MRFVFRSFLAALCAPALALGATFGAPAAHASTIDLHVTYQDRPTRLLAPGMDFVAIARGLAPPRPTYCLGLISMRDRDSIPVSIGTFHPAGGALLAHARVPERVFPTEPPGPFLLFVGRCTDVAPDGVYGATIVTIVPAVG